eukprot:scaffold42983_cov176-Amphora_coffeaeformis.AAC.5
MGVNGVSTGQILRRLATTEHVFTTNGAIVLILVLETLVRLKNRDGDAHAALVAVAEGFHATYTAESTLYAMKRFFGLQSKIREVRNVALRRWKKRSSIVHTYH